MLWTVRLCRNPPHFIQNKSLVLYRRCCCSGEPARVGFWQNEELQLFWASGANDHSTVSWQPTIFHRTSAFRSEMASSAVHIRNLWVLEYNVLGWQIRNARIVLYNSTIELFSLLLVIVGSTEESTKTFLLKQNCGTPCWWNHCEDAVCDTIAVWPSIVREWLLRGSLWRDSLVWYNRCPSTRQLSLYVSC